MHFTFFARLNSNTYFYNCLYTYAHQAVEKPEPKTLKYITAIWSPSTYPGVYWQYDQSLTLISYFKQKIKTIQFSVIMFLSHLYSKFKGDGDLLI